MAAEGTLDADVASVSAAKFMYAKIILSTTPSNSRFRSRVFLCEPAFCEENSSPIENGQHSEASNLCCSWAERNMRYVQEIFLTKREMQGAKCSDSARR